MFEPLARPRAAKHAAPAARHRAQLPSRRRTTRRPFAPRLRQSPARNAAGHGDRAAGKACRENPAFRSRSQGGGCQCADAGADSRCRTVAARRGTSAQELDPSRAPRSSPRQRPSYCRRRRRSTLPQHLPRPLPPRRPARPARSQRPPPHRSIDPGQSGRAGAGTPRDQFIVRPELQEHRDHREAVRLERTRQRRADGGGRRRSPVQRSQSQRHRSADQRRSPGRRVLGPRDVANLFPEVEGFRTFRLPLKI